jgi:hypothetical protein
MHAVGDNNVIRKGSHKFQEQVNGVALVEVVHCSHVVVHDDIQDVPRFPVHRQCHNISISAETQQPRWEEEN